MSDHLEEVFTGFYQARDLIKDNGDSIRAFGYLGDKFDFYRFVNRFRLAVKFKGLEIQDFHDETESTYGALTKMFLTWSTFEMYCHMCDKPYYGMFHNYPRNKTLQLADAYRQHDHEERLINFLIDNTFEHGQAHFLRQFRDGRKLNIITVGACIRHIYAHGHLTAHPQGMEAEDMRAICELFCDYITTFIRSDFQRRLAQVVIASKR